MTFFIQAVEELHHHYGQILEPHIEQELYDNFIPPLLLTRKPQLEKSTRCILSILLKFHAPWISNHLAIFGGCVVELQLLYSILTPWNSFPQDQPSSRQQDQPSRHQEQLGKLLHLIHSSGQSLAICLLCVGGLIALQGRLLSCGNLEDLLELTRNWVDQELYGGQNLESIWSFIVDLGFQTPQSYSDVWDTLLVQGRFGEDVKPLEDWSLLNMSPGEFVNILFRRAELRSYLKGEVETMPETCTEREFRETCGLGLPGGSHVKRVCFKEEAERALAQWQLILVDCRSAESVQESGYRLKNSLNFDATNLPSDDSPLVSPCVMLTNLLDQLVPVRGRYIGFVGDETFVRPGSPTARLVELCLNRGFPKLFVISGGWNAIYQEVRALPEQYHQQLLAPQPKKLWTSEAFRKIADPQVRDSVKAFFEKETGNLTQATDAFKKKWTSFFTSDADPPPPSKESSSPLAKALTGWWSSAPAEGLTEFGLEDEEPSPVVVEDTPLVVVEDTPPVIVGENPSGDTPALVDTTSSVIWAADRAEETEDIPLVDESVPATFSFVEPVLDFQISSQNVSPEVPTNGLDDEELELDAFSKQLDMQVQASLQQQMH